MFCLCASDFEKQLGESSTCLCYLSALKRSRHPSRSSLTECYFQKSGAVFLSCNARWYFVVVCTFPMERRRNAPRPRFSAHYFFAAHTLRVQNVFNRIIRRATWVLSPERVRFLFSHQFDKWLFKCLNVLLFFSSQS